MTALVLQQAVSIWKMIMIFVFFAVCGIFESLGKATGTNMASISLAFKNMNEETSLFTMMGMLMFFNALSANLGMQVTKADNAVVKQSIILLSIPVLYIYHICFGEKKDTFSVVNLIGQLILVTFIIVYVVYDRRAVAEVAAKKKSLTEMKHETDIARRAKKGLYDEEGQRLIPSLDLDFSGNDDMEREATSPLSIIIA